MPAGMNNVAAPPFPPSPLYPAVPVPASNNYLHRDASVLRQRSFSSLRTDNGVHGITCEIYKFDFVVPCFRDVEVELSVDRNTNRKRQTHRLGILGLRGSTGARISACNGAHNSCGINHL
jgi:hypothetical protein